MKRNLPAPRCRSNCWRLLS